MLRRVFAGFFSALVAFSESPAAAPTLQPLPPPTHWATEVSAILKEAAAISDRVAELHREGTLAAEAAEAARARGDTNAADLSAKAALAFSQEIYDLRLRMAFFQGRLLALNVAVSDANWAFFQGHLALVKLVSSAQESLLHRAYGTLPP